MIYSYMAEFDYVYIVYNPNGYVIAVCTDYDKAYKIFKEQEDSMMSDPSVAIKKVELNVKLDV